MAFPKRKNLQDPVRQHLVIVGSKNPVKIQSTEEAFLLTFGSSCLIQGLNIDSGVSKQPVGDEETYAGALNRASNSRIAFPEADFWVGIEGGVQEIQGDWTAFAWMVVLDQAGKAGKARSASFFLPKEIGDLITEGMELGEADDRFFRKANSKQESGAVGILTKGIVDRKDLYKQAVLLGLIPFINPELFPHPITNDQ